MKWTRKRKKKRHENQIGSMFARFFLFRKINPKWFGCEWNEKRNYGKKRREEFNCFHPNKKGEVKCFVRVSLSSIERVSAKEKSKSFDLYKESEFSISIRSYIT